MSYEEAHTLEIYALSLHDALPISFEEDFDGARLQTAAFEHDTYRHAGPLRMADGAGAPRHTGHAEWTDRKSTRLNSSHTVISYAVFCLKKKTRREGDTQQQPATHA